MSAVSNSVMPRSIALWITLREVSSAVRWPKLLQPRPTAETRRPEPPRLRICMDRSCEVKRETISHCDASISRPQGSIVPRASIRLAVSENASRVARQNFEMFEWRLPRGRQLIELRLHFGGVGRRDGSNSHGD